jgi:glycosyltransferase involved in cell wall biosynthesis
VKIAFLSFEYPPETGYGGIGTYTWYQARALVKLGHQVHVIAGANEATPIKTEEHDGVTVFRFRGDGGLLMGLHHLGKLGWWWTKNRLENAVNMYNALRRLMRNHEYDIVEMPECGAEGLLVNHLLRATTLVKFHSPARLIMPFYDVRRGDIAVCSLVEQLGIRRAVAFSACSRFLAQEARDKLGICRPIKVVPNGIDIELFDRAEQVDIRKKFEIPRDRLVILFSGRMERRKGIHLCKEIAESILKRYDVAFVFAGQDLFGHLTQEVLPYLKSQTLRGSVHYLGRLGLTEVRSCLSQTDIFLIPSLWENCPYSCLEAMAAGRAIVSSNQGGMPELICDGENGLLAKAGEPASFVACIERLIEDRGLRERAGKAARKTVEERYTDVHIARISTNHYRECLTGEAAPIENLNLTDVSS